MKDWRVKFPEPEQSQDGAGREGKDPQGQPLEIDQEAILTALRANLGKLTGGASGEGGLGADEEMLMQHITQMLSQQGASLDDIAGGLADALFAPDDESVASEALQERKGDGEFGQWILKQAEAQAGPGASQQSSGQLSPPTDALSAAPGKNSAPLQTPALPLPADRRPPTPASTESSSNSSQRTAESAVQKVAEPAKPRGRKRKADPGADYSEPAAPTKRSATRSFHAPTASSKARNTQPAEKPASKMAARKASKANKK